MIRAHKIRLNPTPEQESYFIQARGVARFAYNWGLEHWQAEYEAGDKPTALRLKKQFNGLKRQQFPFVLEVTKCAIEGAFRDLGKAFENFFRRFKKGEKEVGYPKFRSKKYPRQSFYIANDKIAFDGKGVRIPKLGEVNMTEPLRYMGKVLGAVVSCEAGRWFVSVQVEDGQEPPAKREGEAVGVDLGVSALATLSDGRVFENQKHLSAAMKRLKFLQRSLSRKQPGSHNRKKAKLKLAQANSRVACLRQDAIHKLTTWLSKTYALIGIEDLNVKGLLANHHLAGVVSDAAWGEIRRQLEYKAEWYGAMVQEVDRVFPSSQLCHGCGYRNAQLKLSERIWTCAGCGAQVCRDVNAAQNICDEAMRLKPQRQGSGYI